MWKWGLKMRKESGSGGRRRQRVEKKYIFWYFIMCGLMVPSWKDHHCRPIALRDENWVLMNVITRAESERCCDGEQLTSSVDARWPYSSIILPLPQNLIQNLFLFFTKIHFGVVGPVGRCMFLWWCLIVWWRMIMKKIMKKFSSLCAILALFLWRITWSGPWGMKNVAHWHLVLLCLSSVMPRLRHEGSIWKNLLDENHWMVLTKMHYINKQNKLQPTTYNGLGPFFRMLLLLRLWWWWWKRELNSSKNCEAVVVW